MSYFIIGQHPINDTMDTATVRDEPKTAPSHQIDTRPLESAQRQLDTLRASMDVRLGELEAALGDPSRAAALPALVMELAQLATAEAKAAANRVILEVKYEADAALLDAQERHSVALEAERKTSWEQRRALERAQKRIDELETDHHAVMEAARQQGQKLESERVSRSELEGALATLERQKLEALADLAAMRASASDAVEQQARTYQELADLQQQLTDLEERLKTEHAIVEALGQDKDAAASRVVQLELTLDGALKDLESERAAADTAKDAHARAEARVAELDAVLAAAKQEAAEATATLAADAAARESRVRELAQAAEALAEARRDLETRQAAITGLQSDLKAARADLKAERQAVSALKQAAGEVDALRAAHADAVRDRDAERRRAVDLEQSLASITAELALARASAASLEGAAQGSGRERATLLEELKRVMAAKGTLEAALAQERAHANDRVVAEKELRQSLKQAKAAADAARRDLEQLQQERETLGLAHAEAQQAVAGFDEKLAEIERERDSLSLALDTERMMSADLRVSLADVERRLAETSLEVEHLHQLLTQVPVEARQAAATDAADLDDEETELIFDEVDEDPTRPPGWTGVRAATRYSFSSRIAIQVNGKSGQLINLSTAGCGIRTGTLLETGTSVIVQLPGDAGLSCEGKVVWSRRDGSRRTKAGFRAGVQFTKVDATAVEAFMILEADI